MYQGFVTIAAAIPGLKVADVQYNRKQIENLIVKAHAGGAEVVVFPELSLTGYTCQDLFTQQILLSEVERAVMQLLDSTRTLPIISIIGLPIEVGNLLLNCAIIIQHGNILGIIPKTYLPNYNEFYEKRWFASSQDLKPTEIHYAGSVLTVTAEHQLFRTPEGLIFGVEICEDVWAPVPPSNHLTLAGADLVFNLSASNEITGKQRYLKSLLAQQSARTICGYIYAGSGFGESTQDLVYGGNAFAYENGNLLGESKRFSMTPQLIMAEIDVEMLRTERRKNTTFVNAQRGETAHLNYTSETHTTGDSPSVEQLLKFRFVEAHPFIPSATQREETCEEIFNIQIMGLAKRLSHINCRSVVVGVSGGLDSTLALLVAVKTFDRLGLSRKGIVGVTMPGFGTSDRTYYNAIALMKALGITLREIPIRKAVEQHFADIGHDPNVKDVTYENSQARERTQILMDLSNQLGALLVGTGDLSELALGWATYNGDHMSMYGLNAGIPKTLVQHLVRYVAQCEKLSDTDESISSLLLDIVDTPISPELVSNDDKATITQATEDIVGPYELHDFFLFYMLRYGFRPAKIYLLAQKAFEGKYTNDVIKQWLTIFCRRFFAQQFKRSCLPDGPKVGSVSLSPRGDWRMPSDTESNLWITECEQL